MHDGVWSLYGIDDDRPVAMWSRQHAERYGQRLRKATARENIAEWALGDVTAKNLPACMTKAEAMLATARAERVLWAERLRVIYAAKGDEPLSHAKDERHACIHAARVVVTQQHVQLTRDITGQ